MTARVLPYEEWHRLPEYMDPVVMGLRPSHAQMCVVEDDQGAIVARWLVYTVCFAEDVWIAPAYRGNPGVGRRLWRLVQQGVRRLGFSAALSTALTPETQALLQHPSIGAEVWPGPLMAFSVKE